MQPARKSVPSLLSDDELLAAIRRDLRTVYSEIIREPLPKELAAALNRLDARATPPSDEEPQAAVRASGSARKHTSD